TQESKGKGQKRRSCLRWPSNSTGPKEKTRSRSPTQPSKSVAVVPTKSGRRSSSPAQSEKDSQQGSRKQGSSAEADAATAAARAEQSSGAERGRSPVQESKRAETDKAALSRKTKAAEQAEDYDSQPLEQCEDLVGEEEENSEEAEDGEEEAQEVDCECEVEDEAAEDPEEEEEAEALGGQDDEESSSDFEVAEPAQKPNRAPKPGAQSLAVVVAKANTDVKKVRNSSTNKAEWEAFSRAVANRKSFPTQLAQHATKNKVDLFNAWLDADRCWNQTQLIVERKRSVNNMSSSGWIACQGKTLRPHYPGDKFDQLVQKRKSAGLWYDDADFPGDVDEQWFYMRAGREVKRTDATVDEATMSGKADLDSAMVKALTDEDDGLMAAGALPAVHAQGGQKDMLEALQAPGETVAVAKKKPKPKAESGGSELAKPKSPQELAAARLADLLVESTSARKKSMTLGATEFAGELAAQLLNHAETLEKTYKELQAALATNNTDKGFYTKVCRTLDEKCAWFVTAEAAADSILAGLKRAEKKRNKDKDDNEKEPPAKRTSRG
ncbi:unnamed protein product, partial [Effrenium voratum]